VVGVNLKRGIIGRKTLQGSRLVFSCPIRRRRWETWDGRGLPLRDLGGEEGAGKWRFSVAGLLDCACF
jgi:hypothetical protein